MSTDKDREDQRRQDAIQDQKDRAKRREIEYEEGQRAIERGDDITAISKICGPQAAIDYAATLSSRTPATSRPTAQYLSDDPELSLLRTAWNRIESPLGNVIESTWRVLPTHTVRFRMAEISSHDFAEELTLMADEMRLVAEVRPKVYENFDFAWYERRLRAIASRWIYYHAEGAGKEQMERWKKNGKWLY